MELLFYLNSSTIMKLTKIEPLTFEELMSVKGGGDDTTPIIVCKGKSPAISCTGEALGVSVCPSQTNATVVFVCPAKASTTVDDDWNGGTAEP